MIASIIILGLSVLLQLIAVIMAFRLIHLTREKRAWIMIVIGLFLMEVRRGIPFINLLFGRTFQTPDIWTELVALTSSAILVGGLTWISPLFLAIKRSEDALRESKEWLRTTLASIGDGVIAVDIAGYITFINHKAEELTGWTISESLGKSLPEVFHIIDENTGLSKIDPVKLVLSEKGIAMLDDHTLLLTKKGLKVPIDDSASPIKNEQGDVIGVILVFRDVTERKRAQEEIKNAYQELEQIFNTTADAMRLIDKDFNMLKVNQAISSWLGLDKKEIIGKKCYEMFHGLFCHTPNCPVVRIVGGEEYVEYDVEKERKDGKRISCIMNAAPLRDAKGELLGIVQSYKDITERKQVEETLKLKDEQERLSLIMDGNPIATFVIDHEHRVVLWNRACESLTGASKEKVLGYPVDSGIFYQGQIRPVLADLVLEMDLESMDNLYKDKQLSQSSLINEAFEGQDTLIIQGLRKNLYFLAARLRDADGKIIGAIETIQDTTEREELQKQLVHSQRLEAIGRLAGGVAHDFNNLLVVIRGYSEFLLSRLEENAPMRKEIEIIKTTGDRAASLTRQLLAFSRKQVLQPKVLDINTLVVDMDKMLRRLIGEDVELITILEPNLEKVKADPAQFEQVIMNLVVNARDAMAMGGKLIIKTENNVNPNQQSCIPVKTNKNLLPLTLTKSVCLSVTDTGVGIELEMLDKIFEPFFTTKGHGKGTGLGLSMVYGIVEQHGGCIKVESKPGKGSCFKIYLPALGLPADNKTEGPASFSEYRGQGERVLLVEDEEDVRQFTKNILAEYGYSVFETVTAEDAIETFNRENGNFYLLFSDVVLPGQNGLELSEQLVFQKPDLKILLTSGYADDKSQWLLIRKRNLPFLKKPYTILDLLSTVKGVISG